jgi:hypothetical protein
MAGFIAFATLVWLEHKEFGDTGQQLEKAYAETQHIIHAKEIACVKITNSLIPDSVHLQRNWSNIIDIANDENISIQVYRNDTLLVWTSNEFNPRNCLSELKTGINLLQGVNGNYLAYKNVNGSYCYVLLYLINSSYAFKNQYITNTFNKELSFIREGFVLSKPVDRFTNIKDIIGNYLFSIQIFVSSENLTPVVSILLALVMLINLLLIHVIARKYIQQNLLLTSVLFFGFFAVVRYVNIYYQLPSFLYESKLFDPSVYASSRAVHPGRTYCIQLHPELNHRFPDLVRYR